MVCNLAPQAGVRYSFENLEVYIDSKYQEVFKYFSVLLEIQYKKTDLYLSSSGVYGNSEEVPFKESANVDKLISSYATTKKLNEVKAYTYIHL